MEQIEEHFTHNYSSRKRLKYFFLITIILTLLFLVDLVDARTPQHPVAVPRSPEAMLMVGEELEYSVHYSFFNIGTIRLKVLNRTVSNGRVVYNAAAYMDSNPALAWLVMLHARFLSTFDRDIFSYEWIGEDSTSRVVNYQLLRFNYEKQKMHFEKGRKTKNKYIPYERDTIAISSKCQDGLSLFYFARGYLHQKGDMTVPTCISNQERKTIIHFLGEREKVEIDSVPYPIDCKYFTGTADFTGIFGLTGEFEGWFSNDVAAVPITARLKVILGSIRVELRRWNRVGWVPPRWSSE